MKTNKKFLGKPNTQRCSVTLTDSLYNTPKLPQNNLRPIKEKEPSTVP
jgi:hypothetical protein